MAEIEDRVSKLEKTFARLTGGAIVAGIALLMFFEPLAELLRRPDLAGWIGMTLVGTWLLSCVSWCHP